MNRTDKLRTLALLALLVTSLALGGCRRQETPATGTATPAAAAPAGGQILPGPTSAAQQSLPAAGSGGAGGGGTGVSPLPGTGTSPLKP